MRSQKQQKTVDYYDRDAANWASQYGRNDGESFWMSQIEKLHELLPSGKILEIGSGTGQDAEALAARGYDYTGTDASKGLIEIAQKRNSQATFVHVGVEDLAFPEKSFDGFWTAATLLHIPKENIDNALQSIKSEVRDGGVGVITLKQGEGEKEDEETGRWFSYYSEDEFEKILNRNGFEVVDFEIKKEQREGRPDWLVFYVKV